MTAPEDIPFWERERGGGPITREKNSRARLAEEDAKRELALENPLAYNDQPPRRPKGAGRPSYKQLRAQGLCVGCGQPAGGSSRCASCAVRLSERRYTR